MTLSLLLYFAPQQNSRLDYGPQDGFKTRILKSFSGLDQNLHRAGSSPQTICSTLLMYTVIPRPTVPQLFISAAAAASQTADCTRRGWQTLLPCTFHSPILNTHQSQQMPCQSTDHTNHTNWNAHTVYYNKTKKEKKNKTSVITEIGLK